MHIRDGVLVSGIDPAVHEGDRYGLDAFRLEPPRLARDVIEVKGRQLLAGGAQSARHFNHSAVELRRLDNVQGKEIRALLGTDLKQVSEP
jgi:hypothetical protein